MKPEVIIPRRTTLDRVLVAFIIALAGWYTTWALARLEQADRAAEVQRAKVDECQYAGWLYDGRGFSWRCGP